MYTTTTATAIPTICANGKSRAFCIYLCEVDVIMLICTYDAQNNATTYDK